MELVTAEISDISVTAISIRLGIVVLLLPSSTSLGAYRDLLAVAGNQYIWLIY